MNKNDLTRVMAALGLRVETENHKSHYLNCACPFAASLHANGSDSSPSFGCRYDEHGVSSFKCYACKSNGSMAKLAQRLGLMRHRDYTELVTDIRNIEAGLHSTVHFEPFDRADEALPPELVPINEAIYDGLYPPAWEVPEARDYLISRGIGEQTTNDLGLLYKDYYATTRRDGSVGQWFRGDILFPVRDGNGTLYGWSGRTTRDAAGIKPKVYDPDLPKRFLILGENRWRDGVPKVIIEGLMGYAHLIEIGVEQFCDVGAVMGSVLTQEKAQIIRNWGCTAVGLFDLDLAGENGLFGTLMEDGTRDESGSFITQLINTNVVIVPEWPEGKDDPDQLTYDEVYQMVFSAPPIPVPKVKATKRKLVVDKHLNRRV